MKQTSLNNVIINNRKKLTNAFNCISVGNIFRKFLWKKIIDFFDNFLYFL